MENVGTRALVILPSDPVLEATGERRWALAASIWAPLGGPDRGTIGSCVAS
jgi:hypothetical protein